MVSLLSDPSAFSVRDGGFADLQTSNSEHQLCEAQRKPIAPRADSYLYGGHHGWNPLVQHSILNATPTGAIRYLLRQPSNPACDPLQMRYSLLNIKVFGIVWADLRIRKLQRAGQAPVAFGSLR